MANSAFDNKRSFQAKHVIFVCYLLRLITGLLSSLLEASYGQVDLKYLGVKTIRRLDGCL
ncbi:CLUMA_CG020514, isoform A [Clunio marinus]|uniref:CLUMA_CG020514, isoform A n=1 Tax=Clunio marinus TaxID=568069 RepID=A0A1J1J563_9DIPT|nr:CLUMA_CG020514, isoform A [Clunio marinus]